jgi:hypothetical protein
MSIGASIDPTPSGAASFRSSAARVTSRRRLTMISSPQMSKAELIEAAHEIIGSDLADLSLDKLYRLMTVTQFVIGRCLN